MRLRPFVAVAALRAAALVTGLGVAFAAPNSENGNDFNCTPGNPANAENVHASHGKDDHGNGDDCQPAETAAPTTVTAQPVVASATAAAPTTVVHAQPTLTG